MCVCDGGDVCARARASTNVVPPIVFEKCGKKCARASEMRAATMATAINGAPNARNDGKQSTPSTRCTHKVIYFDCDDALYKNDWKTAGLITKKIESFTVGELGLPPGRAYELYKQYGTCLKGLQEEKLLDESRLEEFLHFAHDIPHDEHIQRDEALRAMLLKIKTPKWIFTASARHHAQRCLEILGVDDLFEGIIDVRAVGWHTKHDARAYQAAMDIAGVTDPADCLFLDDSVSNLKTARAVGWSNVLVGTHARDTGEPIVTDHADHIIGTVHEFEDLCKTHGYDHFHVEDAVEVENAVEN